jgi:hypothetical protein
MSPSVHLAALHAAFLTILPRIERHGRVYFRHLRCSHAKADAIADMVALCWLWFGRLIAKGKDPLAFPMMLATFAARQVNEGRHCVGQEKARDVMSRRAQRRHGFHVESLPASTASSFDDRCARVHGQRRRDVFEERLSDNRITPVPDQVQFRIDFPSWLKTLTGRERRMVRAMAANERTLDVSRRFDVSPARVSQMRRELHNDWQRFCGESATSAG